MYPRMKHCEEILSNYIMISLLLDTQDNGRPLNLSAGIIDGQECHGLWSAMYQAVILVQDQKNFQENHLALKPNVTPDGPWQIVSTDFIVAMPKSNGYDAICVVVD